MKLISLPIRIIIADDHPLYLSGFKSMVNIEEFELVGEALNGQELVKLAKKLKPDIIITDIKMPFIDGIEATKRIMEELPNIGIIALSMIDEYSLIMEMIEAGAKGYLLKNVNREEIIAAVKAVHNGDIFYCRETTAHLVSKLRRNNYNSIGATGKYRFSQVDINVIKLICAGHSNKEIANDLQLNKRTVEWHREHIMRKLDVKNTAGIVVFAIKNKIF